MATKKKRGRGLDKTLINLPRIKRRLEFSLRKIDRGFQDSQYRFIAENIRKDTDTMLKYAKTPEDKLKYIQYKFKLGQLYLWKPWQIGTLSEEKGRDYILRQAMQAEQDQWKYTAIVQRRSEFEKAKENAADVLGLYMAKKPTGLKVRIPKNTDSRELKEYKAAIKREKIAKRKVQQYLKRVEVKEKMYKKDSRNKDKYEQWKNTYNAYRRAQKELADAERDLPLKKRAYERSKKPQAPRARGFLKK